MAGVGQLIEAVVEDSDGKARAQAICPRPSGLRIRTITMSASPLGMVSAVRGMSTLDPGSSPKESNHP